MRCLFLFSVFIIIAGCGRKEIKKPADIIAANSKAVFFTPQLKRVFDNIPSDLSPKFKFYRDGLSAVLDENQAAAVVITSFDPFEVYLALPAKEGLDESLKLFLDEQLQLSMKSESWSSYVFVPLKGNLPASFGNEKFLPRNEDAILYVKVDIEALLEGQDDKLESYKKYETLREFRSFCSDAMNRILTRFVTHDLSDFCKQAEMLQIELNSKKLSGSLTLKPGSDAAESFNSMKSFTLPVCENKGEDLSFASTVDFSKLEFPLKGLETSLKSYLSLINKPEAIFPMDTVFQKLRESGKVNISGHFAVRDETLKGEGKAVAENGVTFNESLSKFCKLMAPEFVSPFIESDSKKKYGKAFFNPYIILGKSVKTEFRMDLDTDKIFLVDKSVDRPSVKIVNSQEKGLLKIFIKPESFLPLELGVNMLELEVTVEENEIKIHAERKE